MIRPPIDPATPTYPPAYPPAPLPPTPSPPPAPGSTPPSPSPPSPMVAPNQAATRVTYNISPAIFTLLCSNATARTTFADDSASALAAQLTRSSGTAVSVAGSVPASACGRRMRVLLQASPTFPVNYLITFPLGTAAATQDSQVRSLVTRINTEGVVALGMVRLGPVDVADITAVAEVVPTMATSFPAPVTTTSESGVPQATQLGLGLGLGLGGGLLAAGCGAAAFILHRRKQAAQGVVMGE
ncbi:hypothetical protein V8C86DRAFT_2629207 [Haematococcus lacustris]